MFIKCTVCQDLKPRLLHYVFSDTVQNTTWEFLSAMTNKLVCQSPQCWKMRKNVNGRVWWPDPSTERHKYRKSSEARIKTHVKGNTLIFSVHRNSDTLGIHVYGRHETLINSYNLNIQHKDAHVDTLRQTDEFTFIRKVQHRIYPHTTHT